MAELFFEKLLNFYNLSEEDVIEDKEKDLSSLPSKDLFKNGKKICSFLKNAISENNKVLIYGDYDCDGIMSTSILLKTLTTNNFKPGYYIPSREFDGYGLNIDNLHKFHDLGYRIIICADNGITLHDVVDEANKLGITIIILDHHELSDSLPNTPYIMHPAYDKFGKYNISAGVVSFYFSLFYLNKFNNYLFVLAMLSTLSDAMPLIDYNRLIVKEGLKILNKYKYQQIWTLLKGSQPENISENELQMQVIPKINSICRVLNDNKRFNIVKYFTSDDFDSVHKLNLWINNTNESRKNLVNKIDLSNIDDRDGFIFYINSENEGIGGLIANKLLNSYNKPTFVFSNNDVDKTIYKGSVRSSNGFNVVECLKENSNLLETFGGHDFAGGFSIKKDKLNDFKNNILEHHKNVKLFNKVKCIDLDIDELSLKNYFIYKDFSPFGEGHIKPTFKISNISLQEFKKFIYNSHIIRRINSEASILLFNFDSKIFDASFINLIGHFSLNVFRNVSTIQFIVSDYELIY